MATFKPVVFSGSQHIKSDGTSRINIRVYHNKKSQYIPTNYYINPKFILKNGLISEEYSGSDHLNFELGGIMQEYRRIIIHHISTKRLQLFTAKKLKDYLVEITESEGELIDFVKFSREHIKTVSKPKTAQWYEDSLETLIWFFNSEEIDVRDITASRLNALVKQLFKKGRKGKPLEPGSISNYMRGIRGLFNRCKLEFNNDEIEIEKISHNPFKKVKIPKYKRKRKNVSLDTIKAIRDVSVVSFRERLGRDIFMMQFYMMGINIADLFKISDPVNGRLVYERSKTDTEDSDNEVIISVKIEPELQELLTKYSSDGFLSDIKIRYSKLEYFNKAVNKGLKSICETLDIDKVTSNWSRHTWASLARNKCEVSKSDIDFCLGHISHDNKMADIYIEPDYSISDRINRSVIDILK